jgi:hypothetical protein
MRVKQLIEYLLTVKGNPEIHLWNGLVEDVVPLDPKGLFTDKLYKASLEHITTGLKMDLMYNTKTFNITPDQQVKIDIKAIAILKDSKFETPNQFVAEEEYPRWYGRSKNILVLQPVIAGKQSYDRLGTISY